MHAQIGRLHKKKRMVFPSICKIEEDLQINQHRTDEHEHGITVPWIEH